MNQNNMDYPKLRPLEAFYTEKELIGLRDPFGFSDKILYLKPPAVFVCSLIDGEHSVVDIQTEYMRQFGQLLYTEQVREIEEKLDSCFFLENERFEEHKNKIIDNFKQSKTRFAVNAGLSYEKDPEALRLSLSALFSKNESGQTKAIEAQSGTIRALMVPHIDIARGGKCYAASYSELLKMTKASTFVVLGIAHMSSTKPFVLTAKEFETPLGNIPADIEFIRGLAKNSGSDLFEDEFLHRNEHSIEFQAVFLRYLFPLPKEIKIVPILCSRVPGRTEQPSSSQADDELINLLKKIIKERGDDVCIIAGVDLSHVGRKFGQEIAINDLFLKQLESADIAMLDLIGKVDAKAFIDSIERDNDARNVCGVPAIHAMLRLIEPEHARLIGYHQSVDYETSSVVTFAGMVFYD
jgi:AmmeMemoRadiSam system protein B